MRHAQTLSRRRTAFTLIELLVVMVLILVIASVGLGYIVFGQDNQHSVNGAQAVTGVLLNAKQCACCYGLPTGLRMIPFTNGRTHWATPFILLSARNSNSSSSRMITTPDRLR